MYSLDVWLICLRYVLQQTKPHGFESMENIWFSIWRIKFIENGGVTHTFEGGPPKDYFRLKFWAEDFNYFVYIKVYILGIQRHITVITYIE
jgi:hypothetical protein